MAEILFFNTNIGFDLGNISIQINTVEQRFACFVLQVEQQAAYWIAVQNKQPNKMVGLPRKEDNEVGGCVKVFLV